MKIYTKSGDKGDTSLFGGKRMPKSSLRIDAYGTVDELNAQIGVARALNPPSEVDIFLEQLQHQLFILGADLAVIPDAPDSKVQRIRQNHVQNLENIIDQLDARLDSLQSFILPGGSLVSAHLHVARAVCRRAERLVDALARAEDIGQFLLVYLNRLSDLLFVLARYANTLAGIQETRWGDGTASKEVE